MLFLGRENLSKFPLNSEQALFVSERFLLRMRFFAWDLRVGFLAQYIVPTRRRSRGKHLSWRTPRKAVPTDG